MSDEGVTVIPELTPCMGSNEIAIPGSRSGMTCPRCFRPQKAIGLPKGRWRPDVVVPLHSPTPVAVRRP